MRVLKFIEPPNPNDQLFQQEGKLFKTYNHITQKESVWLAKPSTVHRWITPTSWKLLEDTYL